MQVLDSSSISLDEFRLRSGFLPVVKTAVRERRDVSEAIRTVFWARGLSSRAGAGTAYRLEKLFEPEAFRRNQDGVPMHRNKWTAYLNGRHDPRTVLTTVERLFPGSNDCLFSPLWGALRKNALEKSEIHGLLAPLPGDINVLSGRRRAPSRKSNRTCEAIDNIFADSLERRASIDALAVTILLLRLSHVEGLQAAASEWGRRVCRMLVLIGDQLISHGIAMPLFDLIDERIMPLAFFEGSRYSIPRQSYLKMVALILEFLLHLRRDDFQTMSNRGSTEQKRKLLNGKHGWDYRFALNPITIVEERFSTHGDRDKVRTVTKSADSSKALQTWGMNMLSGCGHSSFPPPEVVTGDVWAVNIDDPLLQDWLSFTSQSTFVPPGG